MSMVFPTATVPWQAAAPTIADLQVRLSAIIPQIAADASRRDLERELPFAAFQLLRDGGIGTLRIPHHLGGPGGTVVDLIAAITAIGAADSNVAHALRSHFNFTESLVLNPTGTKAREHLDHVLDGKLFGGAHTEIGTKKPGEINTVLVPDAGHWRLSGRKWYATGTAFADYASFSAKTPDGAFVSALIPTDRAGITILDDWDGMGQRLTASGGVRLDNVRVEAGEIEVRALDSRIGRHTSTLRQLHLAAAVGGSVRAVLDEGLAYVKKQARAAAHSSAETARDDHFVQKIIGDIAASGFAIDALLAESARALDRTVAAFAEGDDDAIEAALVDSSLATARAQLVIGPLALKAAEAMFELGGGSATSRKYNFDRHWRNIRTVLNHNPLLHKARIVGDFYLNGTTTHLEEGKVF